MMKALLTVTAVIEMGAGLGLLAVHPRTGSPARIIARDARWSSPSPVGRNGIGRLLLWLCWLLRNEGGSRAMKGLVIAMLLYTSVPPAPPPRGPRPEIVRRRLLAGDPGPRGHGRWCHSLLDKPARFSASEYSIRKERL